jgi:hypothetical protein
VIVSTVWYNHVSVLGSCDFFTVWYDHVSVLGSCDFLYCVVRSCVCTR